MIEDLLNDGMVRFIILLGIIILVFEGIITVISIIKYGKFNGYYYPLVPNSKSELVPKARPLDDETKSNMAIYNKQFMEIVSWHNFFSQLIPIFPLLGVLGTVLGLKGEVDSGNINQMFNGLGLAMNTTIAGLFCAIGLKFIDSFPSLFIEKLNAIFENYNNRLLAKELTGERVSIVTGNLSDNKPSKTSDQEGEVTECKVEKTSQ